MAAKHLTGHCAPGQTPRPASAAWRRGACSRAIVRRIAACAAGQDAHATPSPPGRKHRRPPGRRRPALETVPEASRSPLTAAQPAGRVRPAPARRRGGATGTRSAAAGDRTEDSPASTSKTGCTHAPGNSVTIVTWPTGARRGAAHSPAGPPSASCRARGRCAAKVAAERRANPFRRIRCKTASISAGMLNEHHPGPAGSGRGSWARGLVCGATTDTLALLADLTRVSESQFGYQSRDEEGTQSAGGDAERGWGSCRDFAGLLAEAARSLLRGPWLRATCTSRRATGCYTLFGCWDGPMPGRIFVPGPGWTAFDRPMAPWAAMI